MDKQVEQFSTALEAILQQQVAAHEQLLALLQRKREALRTSDPRALSDLCALENEKVQQISELEKQRLELAARLTLCVDPAAKEPMRMGALAERLPEPARGRLLVQRQQLIERMTRVGEATHIARRAAEALVKHVQGLAQTIGALSTGVSTYGRHGALPQHATAVRTINMTA